MDLTELAQLLVARAIEEGDLVIDATVGNGCDTVFLARAVGKRGAVLGLDIQEEALRAARERLERENLLSRTRLVRRSHAEMREALADAGETRRPQAIMFNLGYLPGGDKTVTTVAEETLAALDRSSELVAPGGILTVVVYPGHQEGEREARLVLEWAERLPAVFRTTVTRPLARAKAPPCLLAIHRRRASA